MPGLSLVDSLSCRLVPSLGRFLLSRKACLEFIETLGESYLLWNLAVVALTGRIDLTRHCRLNAGPRDGAGDRDDDFLLSVPILATMQSCECGKVSRQLMLPLRDYVPEIEET